MSHWLTGLNSYLGCNNEHCDRNTDLKDDNEEGENPTYYSKRDIRFLCVSLKQAVPTYIHTDLPTIDGHQVTILKAEL